MKVNVYGVYGIFNVTKEKWYVGQSKNVYERLSGHKSRLQKHIEHNIEMQKDFADGDVFIFTPIETEPDFPITDLDSKENYYINKLVVNSKNKGYNKVSNTSNVNPETAMLTKYQEAVVLIKEYQKAIDIYQANIKRLEADNEYYRAQNIIRDEHISRLLALLQKESDAE